MNIFPVWMERVWDAWVIRVLVLVSLSLQIILILFGSRRKKTRGVWIRVVVWCAYLMADWVAAVALGRLAGVNSCNMNNNNASNNAVMALWAPLLLLHLGGPDTITAYSVEDVRLWLRHLLQVPLLGLLVVYVFIRFWTGESSRLFVLNIPLFIAGIIKYGERTCVMWSANSVFPHPLLPIYFDTTPSTTIHPDAKLLASSYIWLQALIPCLARSGNLDGSLISSEITQILYYDHRQNALRNSFKFVELQMGFMYDVLYAKASKIYTTGGFIVRSISFICVVAGLLGFILVAKDDEYSSSLDDADVCITYVLLVGAFVLEVYAAWIVMYSDWAILLLSKHCVNPILHFLAPWVLNDGGKRWAGSVGQVNLLSCSLYDEHNTCTTLLHSFLKLLSRMDDHKFKVFMCQRNVDDLDYLKELIFEEVKKILRTLDGEEVENIFPGMVRKVLTSDDERYNYVEDPFERSVSSGFDRSIMVWHITTSYCYYYDDHDDHILDGRGKEISKLVSDYMMYLLLNPPYLLTAGKDKICDDVTVIFGYYAQLKKDIRKEEGSVKDWQRILDWNPTDSPMKAEEKDYATILVDARNVAKTLKQKDKKWKVISQVWLAMLCHGAANSELVNHLHQLRRGGELLTQLWLLLNIHGLTGIPSTYFLRSLFKDAVRTETDGSDDTRSGSDGDGKDETESDSDGSTSNEDMMTQEEWEDMLMGGGESPTESQYEEIFKRLDEEVELDDIDEKNETEEDNKSVEDGSSTDGY